MMDIIERVFRNLGRVLSGEYEPPARAGRLLADGTFLDLNKLTAGEQARYQRTGDVPERFGKPASDKQLQRFMHHQEKKRPLPADLRARFEALHGDADKYAWENPARWREYLATGRCCDDHPPAPLPKADEKIDPNQPGPSFPGYGTR